MTYRLLVTGSRTWRGMQVIFDALERVHALHPDLLVVHGDAPIGVDAIAQRWCETVGVPSERHPYPPRTGRAGGMFRNSHMVNLGADECLAFRYKTQSPGTVDCLNKAVAAGIPTRVIVPEGIHP